MMNFYSLSHADGHTSYHADLFEITKILKNEETATNLKNVVVHELTLNPKLLKLSALELTIKMFNKDPECIKKSKRLKAQDIFILTIENTLNAYVGLEVVITLKDPKYRGMIAKIVKWNDTYKTFLCEITDPDFKKPKEAPEDALFAVHPSECVVYIADVSTALSERVSCASAYASVVGKLRNKLRHVSLLQVSSDEILNSYDILWQDWQDYEEFEANDNKIVNILYFTFSNFMSDSEVDEVKDLDLEDLDFFKYALKNFKG